MEIQLDNKHIILNKHLLCDLELIMNSALYPLNGFMTEMEYYCVLENMQLLSGDLFALPINLPITINEYDNIKGNKYITLKDEQLFSLAILEIIDIYKPNLEKECVLAYGTSDENHPYVNIVMKRKNMYYIGGNIVKKISSPKHYDFKNIRLTPDQTKSYFKEHNWTTVIGFQTRNPMHKSHFELTKLALCKIDVNAKLLLHPVVGPTQACDVDYPIRVKCYEEIIKHYEPGQVLLSLLQLHMRMAGPREALHHALIRQNYGCTHFIIGRDHAGPSYKNKNNQNFYGDYDAQVLALSKQSKLNIKIIVSDNVVYVEQLNKYLPHCDVPPNMTIMNISGTQQRHMLSTGIPIPEWFTFSNVYDILKKEYATKSGICLYFVGLSGAGKTTLANAIIDRLKELMPDRKVTYLDGDIVRLLISKGLGFSKEDRSTNARRIGYIASEIVKHNGLCIVANIAPYDDDRKHNRNIISQYGNYIEIYVDTPLNVCEMRDCKGLYRMAKNGEISNFTGISDPFEIPSDPELILNGEDDVDFNIDIIIKKISQLI
jgi:sulfate adenylyltransferase